MTAGFVVAGQRSLLEVRGKDAASHLQRFCTNDLTVLANGQGREAMFLNVKGKLLAFVEVLRLGDRWLLFGQPNQAQTLIEHLDRYVIREEVLFSDLSESLAGIAVLGDGWEQTVEDCTWRVPPELPGCEDCDEVLLIRTREFESDGVWVFVPKDKLSVAKERLGETGREELPGSSLEMIRLLHQYPAFSVDIDEGYLPQELQRDSVAISFTKGCYLGQETVARIDALGHVNRLVCGLRGHGQPPGTTTPVPVTAAENPAGSLTSASGIGDVSNGWIGLATLKRAFAKPGQLLQVAGEEVEVLAHPFVPTTS